MSSGRVDSAEHLCEQRPDINNFLKFYKIDEYLLKFFNHKIRFSFELLHQETETDSDGQKQSSSEKIKISSKSKLILNKADIKDTIKDFLEMYNRKYNQSGYSLIVGIEKIDIFVAKVQTLNGKSYKDLPNFIKN